MTSSRRSTSWICDALGGQVCGDVVRDAQFLGGDEHEPVARVARGGLDERMDRAAELEVAAAADGESCQLVLHRADGQQVRQRLRRVQVTAVAGVDDRNGRVLAGDARRPFLGVTHDDDVGVAGHRADGVRDTLALGDRAGGWFGEADDVAAETEHGSLKTETGAGGGFVEECCENG